MAIFTALAAIATIGGTLAAHKQQKKAEAEAKREAKKQEDKAAQAAALRAPKEQTLRTKIGVADAGSSSAKGTAQSATTSRQSGSGLGGLEVSASKIGGL